MLRILCYMPNYSIFNGVKIFSGETFKKFTALLLIIWQEESLEVLMIQVHLENNSGVIFISMFS